MFFFLFCYVGLNNLSSLEFIIPLGARDVRRTMYYERPLKIIYQSINGHGGERCLRFSRGRPLSPNPSDAIHYRKVSRQQQHNSPILDRDVRQRELRGDAELRFCGPRRWCSIVSKYF